MNFYLLFGGIILTTISLGCWIACAKPLENWRELDELHRETQATQQIDPQHAVCYTITITEESLKNPSSDHNLRNLSSVQGTPHASNSIKTEKN